MTLSVVCLVLGSYLDNQGKKAQCPGNIYYVHLGRGGEEEQTVYEMLLIL